MGQGEDSSQADLGPARGPAHPGRRRSRIPEGEVVEEDLGEGSGSLRAAPSRRPFPGIVGTDADGSVS
jgi:hypothetical protein